MAVLVGRCRVEILVCDSRSLKDRRRVLHSLMDQLRQRFNVSVAQLDRGAHWGRAVLGIAVVANERRFLDRVLAQVVNAIEHDARLSLLSAETEID